MVELTRVQLITKIEQNVTILSTRFYDSTNTYKYRGVKKYLSVALFSLSCSMKAKKFTKFFSIYFLQKGCEHCFYKSLIFAILNDIRGRKTSATHVVYL